MHGNSSRAIIFCDTPKLMRQFVFFRDDVIIHHFIGKRPVGWKQAVDGKFRKVFFDAYSLSIKKQSQNLMET